MFLRRCAVLLFVAAAPAAPAQDASLAPVAPEASLTLEAAQRRALEIHPALVAAGHETRAALARESAARAGLDPVLTLEGEGLGADGGAEWSLWWEQPFRSNARRAGDLSVAHADVRLARLRLLAKRAALRETVTLQWARWAAACARMKHAADALALAEADQQRIAARVEAGRIAAMEERRARAETARLRARHVTATGEVRSAAAGLAALLALPEPPPSLADPESELARHLAAPFPETAPPTHHLPGGALAEAETGLGRERARVGGLREEALSLSAGVRDHGGEESWLVGVSVPLRSPRRQAALRAEGVADTARIEALGRAAQQDAAAGWGDAVARWSAARDAYFALRAALDDAAFAEGAAQEIHAAGKQDVGVLLQARRESLALRLDALQALEEGMTARARLDAWRAFSLEIQDQTGGEP